MCPALAQHLAIRRRAALFAGGDFHRKLVLDIIGHCDQRGHWPGWLYQAAPELAADMLDDGLAATRPNDQRRLIDLALRCLDGPVPEDPKAIAGGLAAAATNSTEHQRMIRSVLRDAVNTSGVRQSVAAALLRYGSSFGSHLPGLPEDMNRYVDMWLHKAPSGRKHTVGQLLRDALQRYTGGQNYPGRELIDDALTECDQLVLRRTASGDLWSVSSGKVFKLRASARGVGRLRRQHSSPNRFRRTRTQRLGGAVHAGPVLLAGRGALAHRLTVQKPGIWLSWAHQGPDHQRRHQVKQFR